VIAALSRVDAALETGEGVEGVEEGVAEGIVPEEGFS
jgi:hypothetical protein